MEFDLKWVHMARYELILRLDGALWLTIIFKPLLTPKRAIKIKTGWGRAGIVLLIVRTLLTFWATRILILRIVMFGIFLDPKFPDFQVPRN